MKALVLAEDGKEDIRLPLTEAARTELYILMKHADHGGFMDETDYSSEVVSTLREWCAVESGARMQGAVNRRTRSPQKGRR